MCRFRFLPLLFVIFLVPAAAFGQCKLSDFSPSVTICTPAPNDVVTSPVNVVAGTTDNDATVIAMAIYVDNVLATKQNVSKINANIAMSTGKHYLVVQAWDSKNRVFKTPEYITVAASAPFGFQDSALGPDGTSSVPQNQVLTVQGWAADKIDGAPVSRVVLYIDNKQVGTATLGFARPDIAKQFNDQRYLYSGWKFTYNVGDMALGNHTVASIAYNKAGAHTKLTTYGGSGSFTVTQGGDITQLNHIIFMLQENRSFDNYFGMMNVYRAQHALSQNVDAFTLDGNGNPTNDQLNYEGNGRVKVFHMKSMCIENLSPFWNESHLDANRFNPTSETFLNDGILFVAAKNARDSNEKDIEGLRSMGYYDWNDLPYYYFMASQFGISDRWFSPAPTNTNENRHYMYAATSTGHVYPWKGNPSTSTTIFDELEAAGVTWKVYVANVNATVFNQFESLKTKYPDHLVPMQQYFDDLKNGTLPRVATLETNGLDEHPSKHIQRGAAFVKSAIDALMTSKYWTDSAFILSYDEFGGLYDHALPQHVISPDGIKPVDLTQYDFPGDFTRTGFRVPLIVVSPFSRKHYVSHTPADHTAILRLIEKRFHLNTLTSRDAAQFDMTEFFDFAGKPWATPPQTPAQPTDGPCYYDHLP
ncbi:MAG: alkaline phosphatase family protein [Terriglobales bacterium]